MPKVVEPENNRGGALFIHEPPDRMTQPASSDLRIEDFRDYLMVLARSKLSTPDGRHLDASDIVQETLLDAHRSLEQFRGTESASMAAWLRQILAFNVADRLRSLGRQKRDTAREVALDPSLEESNANLERWVASHQSSPSAKMVRVESLLALSHAMEQLPESQREAVRMRYIETLSLREIAARLERTETAVAGLLKRGLETLRGYFRDA